MKTDGRTKFKRWLTNRGIKMSFAAEKMEISYAHLTNWLAERDGLSAKAGLKIEAFTGGEIKMIDCILPGWETTPLFVWGRGRITFEEMTKKRGVPKRSKSFWE